MCNFVIFVFHSDSDLDADDEANNSGDVKVLKEDHEHVRKNILLCKCISKQAYSCLLC